MSRHSKWTCAKAYMQVGKTCWNEHSCKHIKHIHYERQYSKSHNKTINKIVLDCVGPTWCDDKLYIFDNVANLLYYYLL